MILRLLERFSPGIPPFEEVESRVQETLYSQRMEPKMREYSNPTSQRQLHFSCAGIR